MASVTQRISQIVQPRGGYLPVKSFSTVEMSDGITLNETENISPALVGLTVDYLCRFMSGEPVYKAFNISFRGAEIIHKSDATSELSQKITGLDDNSIISACQLCGFDVCYRSSPAGYRPIENINPDKSTIENIRIMVNRGIAFLDKYGPITKSEVTFEGGYTATVNAGDGDFLTSDTLWDFKVSKSKPTAKHTLQLLMYYVMGLHSIHSEFEEISYLGIFNPRLNTAYIFSIDNISKEIISIVENQIICYSENTDNSLPTDIERVWQEINKSKDCDTIPQTTYSVTEVCTRLGIQKSQAYKDIKSGNLTAYKKGNKYYITTQSLDRYKDLLRQRALFVTISSIGAIAISIILLLHIFLKIM